MIRQLLNVALIKRFIITLRQEGPRMALSKARIFIGMKLRGHAPSALNASQGSHTAEHAYLHGVWQDLAQGHAFHPRPPSQVSDHRRIALIGDLNLPQCRKYRVEQLAAFWEAQGIPCEYAHYQDTPRATRLLAQATHVVEYRLQSTPLTEMLRYEARRLRLPILYDLDDPLFSVSAYETYGNMEALDPGLKAHFLSEAPKYLAMMNGADIISVSTPGMAEHTRLYTNRPVHVRRNFADAETLVDGQRALKRQPVSDGLFRVCFASGSQGHEIDFAEIAEVVAAFVTQDPDRRFMLLGHFDLEHLPEGLAAQTEVIPFTTYDKYLAALARADCAVMPLCDDIFNQCKSAVRVIDAASVNVPAIVGVVGDLQNMVRHGETGFVAQTPADWATALETLGNDRTLAAQMGMTARRNLEQHWVGSQAPHVIAPEIVDWVRA